MELLIYHKHELELFDSILTTVRKDSNNGNIHPFNLYREKFKDFAEDFFYEKINYLEHHGLISKSSNDKGGPANNVYVLNTTGIEFINNGGFLGEYNRQRAESDRIIAEQLRKEKKEQLEIEQIQSVIGTNDSVTKTNGTIRLTSWITVLIVSVTLVVSVMDYKKEDTKVPLSIKELKQEIKELKESIKQLTEHPISVKIDSTK